MISFCRAIASMGAGVLAFETVSAPAFAEPPRAVAQFVPAQSGVRASQLYKLRYLAAKSVATLLQRSFAGIRVTVVPEVNGVTVVATQADQARIADALAQLDVPAQHPAAPSVPAGAPAYAAAVSPEGGAAGVDVVTLHAALPGINGGQSSSAGDIASAVLAALQPQLPDLHVTVYADQTRLLLTGSPASIRVARQLIDKLDALPKMVVLDVTIVEVDENVSKNLGLSLNPTVISTTYSETTPAAPANGGAAPPLLGLQQLMRTPLSLGVQLNLLIQNGKAKIIADPKLTTLSGRTASIRAGDNIAILTTTGGSVGTVATTQLVTFNTGVQLDITPVINADDFISVSIHPTVNNLASVTNGVPQISTRDTQTTVALREGQTLVIGGLIEDSNIRSEQKIPVLGYLPVLGPIFTQSTVNNTRDELIISVTPHIVNPLSVPPAGGPAMTDLPSPAPLPTLAPATVLPPQRTPAPRETPISFIALPASGAPVAATGGAPVANPTSAPTVAPSTAAAAYVYGSKPASLPLSAPNDPPRILYLSASPQVVQNGTTVAIQAVTTINVARVVVQVGAASVTLHQAGPGLWDTTVLYSAPNTSQMAGGPRNVASISAIRADGVAASLNIPLTVAP